MDRYETDQYGALIDTRAQRGISQGTNRYFYLDDNGNVRRRRGVGSLRDVAGVSSGS